MINLKKVLLINEKSFDEELRGAIPEMLCDNHVIDKLKKQLLNRCDHIMIEYPYHDMDYLSTYYIHYSQKLNTYNKMCCRLHVFKNDDYFGYIILRPTVEKTKFGKTLLDPRILINEKAHLALHDFKAHIVGNEMSIQCFPWKSQQTDISICAHTASWTVIKYFGNKFKNYSDTTIGDIVGKTKNDWGRKTPSLGLDPVQVSDVFKEYGFSPLILQKNNADYTEFVDEVVSYIDSGLPMVGFLSPIKHAVSVIGYGAVNFEILDDKELVEEIKDKDINVIPHSRLIKSLYVMDDNYFPYMKMPLDLPDSGSDVDYGMGQLEYAVVPLYSRMQLVYNEVYSKFRVWMENHVMNWSTPSVARIYITSATSIKREAMNSTSMANELKDLIVNLVLPKFVWCIDLSTFDDYKLGLTSGRILIDTTSATLDDEPWILRHDSDEIHYYEMDKLDTISKKIYSALTCPISAYSSYENNLKIVERI